MNRLLIIAGPAGSGKTCIADGIRRMFSETGWVNLMYDGDVGKVIREDVGLIIVEGVPTDKVRSLHESLSIARPAAKLIFTSQSRTPHTEFKDIALTINTTAVH